MREGGRGEGGGEGREGNKMSSILHGRGNEGVIMSE